MPLNEDGTAAGGGYTDKIKTAECIEDMMNEDGTYGKLRSSQRQVDEFMKCIQRTNELVSEEVMKQIGKWGVQDHPSFDLVSSIQQAMLKVVDVRHLIPVEDVAKDRCEEHFKNGSGTWCDILVEELAEALGAAYRNMDATGTQHHVEGEECPDYCADVIGELVQVVAVGVSWVTNLIVRNNRKALDEYYAKQDEAKERSKERYLKQMKEWGIDLGAAEFETDEHGNRLEWGTIYVSREMAELAQGRFKRDLPGLLRGGSVLETSDTNRGGYL